MSQRDDRRDDDIAERLDELAAILEELRADLRESDRRSPPRPPRLTELLRFTEQYTIPTVIALLETTITSLELVRGALRLVDPEGRLDDDRRRARGGTEATESPLGAVRDGARTGLTRSLSELQRALEQTDLPEETVSRTILEEARDLSAEIEARIEAAEDEVDANRRADPKSSRPEENPSTSDRNASASDRLSAESPDAVHIDVTGPDSKTDERDAANNEAAATDTETGASAETTEASTETTGASTQPAVDVESELASIKQQLDDSETVDEQRSDDQSLDERSVDGHADEEPANGDNADGDRADRDRTASHDSDVESETDTRSDSNDGNETTGDGTGADTGTEPDTADEDA